MAQGAQRGGAGQAVDRQAGGPLEGDERGVRAAAEPAVEPTRLVAAPGEQELERRDVPAALPAVQDARAKARATAPAERAARLRAGDAVDQQAMALLEGAHAA